MATICLLLGYGVILPITFVPCEECFPWIGKSLESVLAINTTRFSFWLLACFILNFIMNKHDVKKKKRF